MELAVQATINALGYLENGVYYPEPDCFESIRDLIRFLRSDTATVVARRLCGERNIIGCDLIPIMKSPTTSDRLFDGALRLTINLCQPAKVVFGGRYPEDNETRQAYAEVEKNLANSKEAFGDLELFKVFERKTASYFSQEWLDRREEMKIVIERIVALVCCILSIGDTDLDKERSPQDINSHDQLILVLLESGFGKLLVDVSTNPSNYDFHLWILEIFAMMLKQYEAKNIVEAGQIRSTEEKSKQELEMRKVVEQEMEKLLYKRRNMSSRHTAFAGSYILKGLKAINKTNDIVINKVIKNCNEMDHLNKHKLEKRIPRNRRLFDMKSNEHFSSLSIRLALRSFCLEMLQKSYCRLMNGCKDKAFSSRRTLGKNMTDVLYFILMQFSMEFRRLGELPLDYVKATLDIEAFHHVQTHLDTYLENARTEREEGFSYGLRAHYALAAFKELLLTLISILKCGKEEWKKEVESTCLHILKVEEYRDLSSSIIRKFVPSQFSKAFLRNIVLANHAYMTLIEKFSRNGMLATVVRRQKMRKKKSKTGAQNETAEKIVERRTKLDVDLWQEISEELSDVVFGYIDPTPNICAIDVLLNVEEEIHQQFAMLLIQQALRQRRIADAVGLYRSARDLWPEEGVFGTNDMTVDNEFLELRAIFFSNLEKIKTNWERCQEEVYGVNEEESIKNDLYEKEIDKSRKVDGDEESYESDEGYTVEKEIDFNFNDYITKFARIDVLKWYVFVLNDFETNTAEVNKAVLKLLHRVAFDLMMTPCLYQLSLFNIFKSLAIHFKNYSVNEIKKTQYFGIYQFGYHLLRRFYIDYQKLGSKLIPEILFWKGPKEICCGYDAFEIKKKTNKNEELLWPEELDIELKTLHEEYMLFEEKPEGVDVVEYVQQGLSRARTRRQIIRQMKMRGLSTSKANKWDTGGILKSSLFTPEVVDKIHRLVKEFNLRPFSSRTGDLVNFIRKNLPHKYTRARIIKQLQYENISYDLSPKKRRLKTSSELKALGDSRDSDEKVFGDAAALRSNVFHGIGVGLNEKRKRTKRNEEMQRDTKYMERSSSENSNYMSSSGTSGLDVFEYNDRSSSVVTRNLEKTGNIVTNSSSNDKGDIVLEKEEEQPSTATTVSIEVGMSSEKVKSRKRRIIESDSE